MARIPEPRATADDEGVGVAAAALAPGVVDEEDVGGV